MWKLITAAAVVALASGALADEVFTKERGDLMRQNKKWSLVYWENDTLPIRFYLYIDGAKWVPSSGWGGAITYSTNFQFSTDYTQATGVVNTVTNFVEFFPTTAFSSTTGQYFAQIRLTNSSGTKVTWPEGRIEFKQNPVGGSGSAIVFTSPLDWDALAITGDAPYVGTNFNIVSSNAHGIARSGNLITLHLETNTPATTDTDTTFTNYLAVGAGLTLTGGSRSGSNTLDAAAGLTNHANQAHLEAAETIAGNWVNTANPWADNEVANALTVDDAGIASTIARDSEVDTATNTLDAALRALTNTAGSVDNSGSTFIQDAILDANGNITNWVSAAAGGADTVEHGAWYGGQVRYVDKDTITVDAFSVYMRTTLVGVHTQQTYDVTQIVNSVYTYFYADADDGTIYNATNVPVDSGYGWYHEAATNDRAIPGPVYMTNSGVAYFYTNPDGSHHWPARDNSAGEYVLAWNFSPDGTLQAPTTESSTLLPVGASGAFIHIQNTEATANDYITVTVVPKEFADTAPNATASPPYGGYHMGWINDYIFSEGGTHYVSIMDWIDLGASGNIRIGGDDNDDNSMKVHLMGRQVRY